MKKSFSLCMCILTAFVLLSAPLGAALADGGAEPVKASRTVMLYFCGSNLETCYEMVTWNLKQIMNAEISPEVNVIGLTGGSREWHTEAEYLEGAEAIGGDKPVQAWLFSGKNAENAENGHGKMTFLADWPEAYSSALMNDEKTLLAFINYAAAKCPADLYDLVLWDHGGGPHGGFGIDDYDPTETPMSIGSVMRAVKDSTVERFSIIDFDACLMSSAEIAAALGEHADYLVVSSETEPGYGQEYTTWFNALSADPRINGFDLGKAIVDAYVAFYEDENKEGYGQEGVLSVIDTKNFRERMTGPLTKLAETMNKELTTVGRISKKLNFNDELKAGRYSYNYADPALTDLSALANSLGLTRTEIENLGLNDFSLLENAYTPVTGEIEKILADQDGSGDDVIYCRSTKNMERTTSSTTLFVRGTDGKPTHGTSIFPTGMSVFYAPADPEATMKYLKAMQELGMAVENEETKALFRALETAAARGLLVYESGCAVSALAVAGDKNIYYKDVYDYWTEQRELGYYEIELYKQQMGLTANITGMKSAKWDEFIGKLIGTLDVPQEETETWLALVAGQQATEAIAADRVTASGVDKNADGVLDAYRVSIPSSRNMVKDVSIRIDADYISPFEEDPSFHEFLFGNKLTLGKIHGTPVMDSFLADLKGWSDLDYAVRQVYRSESTDYELPTSVDNWYELVDSDGTGHVISVGEIELSDMSELLIPVYITLPEKDEDGDPKHLLGFLHYANGSFTGFSEEVPYSSPVALNNKVFEGATLQTAQYTTLDLFGFDWYLFEPISTGFPISPDMENWGMKLVMTKMDDIRDLQGLNVAYTSLITDLYDFEYDIGDAISDADRDAADGRLARSIETAACTVGEIVYDGEAHRPLVTVSYGGTELKIHEDYDVLSEKYTEPGTYKAILFGMGDYMGYQMITFEIKPASASAEGT